MTRRDTNEIIRVHLYNSMTKKQFAKTTWVFRCTFYRQYGILYSLTIKEGFGSFTKE